MGHNLQIVCVCVCVCACVLQPLFLRGPLPFSTAGQRLASHIVGQRRQCGRLACKRSCLFQISSLFRLIPFLNSQLKQGRALVFHYIRFLRRELQVYSVLASASPRACIRRSSLSENRNAASLHHDLHPHLQICILICILTRNCVCISLL